MSMAAQSDSSVRSGRKFRTVGFLFAALLLLAASLTGLWRFMKQRDYEARKLWKERTIEQLAESSRSSELIRRELDDLKGGPKPNVDFGWTHENVLLMTNGEYIVYAHRHGANSGFVDHLFLGQGSDGRWLYSTYHFCNSMAMVGGEDAPGSIDEFAQRYSAREFDGESDECLQHTWPPDR